MLGQVGLAAEMTGLRQRKQNLLTARTVEAAKGTGRYSDGNGLYLVVRPGGSKQWVFLYRRDGKLKEMGLGSPLKGVTLPMARDLRDEARAIMARGGDPLEARRQAEQSVAGIPTFGVYALALIDRIEEGFSNPKHRQQWRNTLQTYCQPIWTLPIDRVDPAGVLACLTPIWQSKPETASRLPICSGQRLDDVSGAKAGPDESVACTTSSCAGFHAPPSVARFLAYRSRDRR
jgi:hypothetical protein